MKTRLLKADNLNDVRQFLEGKTILVQHQDDDNTHYFAIAHEQVLKVLLFYSVIQLLQIEEEDDNSYLVHKIIED